MKEQVHPGHRAVEEQGYKGGPITSLPDLLEKLEQKISNLERRVASLEKLNR